MSGKPIGILGGTFDPVHHGHLRFALEMSERLDLAEVRLVPLHQPPHRSPPVASPALRLAMLEAAVAGEPTLRIDDRELRRGGISYTVDTLISLREEIGTRPLCLLVGMDAFSTLPNWHQSGRIPELAHVTIARRPGTEFPRNEELARLVEQRRVDDVLSLHRESAGRVMLQSLPLLDIAASRIRVTIAAGGNVRYLLPDAVIELIRAHALYREEGTHAREDTR